jgi:hypothetical protein
MASRLKPEANAYAAVQKFWELHRKILRARGIDPAKWAVKQARRLNSLDARTGFKELTAHGCAPPLIALFLVAFRISPILEGIWEQFAGNETKRKKVSRTLQKTASIVEGIFHDSLLAEYDRTVSEYRELGRIPVSELVFELRLYSDFVDLPSRLPVELGARSIPALLKYLLVAYVKRTTGRFHDRNVAALLADVIGPASHNEVAQSMWRQRNYDRMEEHFSRYADFLFALGSVITRTT